jgi:hypothetical protein
VVGLLQSLRPEAFRALEESKAQILIDSLDI